MTDKYTPEHSERKQVPKGHIVNMQDFERPLPTPSDPELPLGHIALTADSIDAQKQSQTEK